MNQATEPIVKQQDGIQKQLIAFNKEAEQFTQNVRFKVRRAERSRICMCFRIRFGVNF